MAMSGGSSLSMSASVCVFCTRGSVNGNSSSLLGHEASSALGHDEYLPPLVP